MDDLGIEIRTTRDEIEKFKESILWKDIEKELTVWKEGFEIELRGIVDDAESKNPSTAAVLLHMGDLNGRIKAVDYVLSMLDVFLNILEEQKDESTGRDRTSKHEDGE